MEHVVFDGAQVMVGDPKRLQAKLSSIQGGGPSKLQVCSVPIDLWFLIFVGGLLCLCFLAQCRYCGF